MGHRRRGRSPAPTFGTEVLVESPRGNDIFVAKMSSNGALVYYTYIGGTGNDSASGVTTDGQGLPVLSGTTESNDFPYTTTGTGQLHAGSDSVVVQMNRDRRQPRIRDPGWPRPAMHELHLLQ